MHWSNVGYIERPGSRIRLQLIDFGFSHHGRCDPCLEVAALIRSLRSELIQTITPRNRKRLTKKLTQEVTAFQDYTKTQGCTLATVPVTASFRQLNAVYNRLHNKNMRIQSQKKSSRRR